MEAAPSGASGSDVRCSRCGATSPAGLTNCGTCGVFLPANEANLRHGLRRFQTTGRLPEDLRVTVEEFREAVISDQGGLEELSAVRAGLVRVLVDAEVIRRMSLNEAVKRGIDSRPGRAALQLWLAATDRWVRVGALLGLERRTREIPFAEALRDALTDVPPARTTETAPASSPAPTVAPGGVASTEE